jgi:uracil-DNA glycosylase family 4
MRASNDCTSCGLCHTRTKVVNGSGPMTAKVWVIGQNPGATEELVGYPLFENGFSGDRVRNHLLPLAGIDQRNVRFDNINKCRPGRKPDRSGDGVANQLERDECFDLLLDDILTHKPELIITLGDVAFKQFFPDMRKERAALKKYHGKPMTWECDGVKCRVIPMYHPASATPNRHAELGEIQDGDWKRISSSIGPRVRKYERVNGDEAGRRLEGIGIFAFDYETTDPNWNRTFQARRAREIGFSIGTNSGAVYSEASSTYIRRFLEDDNVEVIAHNAKFEWIVAKGVGIGITNLHDTKLMAYVLRKPSTELKDLAWNELGVTMTRYEEVDWDDIDQVTQYGAADSDMTYQLYFTLKQQLEEQGMWHIYEEIERPMLNVLAEMEMNGVYIDKAPLQYLQSLLIDEAINTAIEIAKVYPYPVNWRSVKQKSHALYGLSKWLVQPGKKYKGRLLHIPGCDKKLKAKDCGCTHSSDWLTMGMPIYTGARQDVKIEPPGLALPGSGTDMDALRVIRNTTKHPICDLLIKHNSIHRLMSMELDYMPKLVQEDDRLHCSYHQAGSWEETGGDWKEGAETGRLSSSGPNLQNITHHGDPERPYVREWAKYIRRAFSTPTGRLLIKADIGQEEPRIAAALSSDTQLQYALEAGDVYKPLAALAFGKREIDINTEERQVGKAIFLEWLYEGRDFTAKAPWLTDAQREQILTYQRMSYQDYMHYRIRQLDFLDKYGYTKTWFGRRRTFPAYHVSKGSVRAELERKALNHPIQGTGADVLKLAMIKVAKEFREHDIRWSAKPKMILNVHDEIVVEVHEWDATKAAKICMNMTKDILPIRLPVEVSYGENWEDQIMWGAVKR